MSSDPTIDPVVASIQEARQQVKARIDASEDGQLLRRLDLALAAIAGDTNQRLFLQSCDHSYSSGALVPRNWLVIGNPSDKPVERAAPSVRAMVEDVLLAHPGMVFNYDQLLETLEESGRTFEGSDQKAPLRNAVHTLVQNGIAERVDGGRFRLRLYSPEGYDGPQPDYNDPGEDRNEYDGLEPDYDDPGEDEGPDPEPDDLDFDERDYLIGESSP